MTMRKQKQVTIRGQEYLLTSLGGVKGLKLGKKVGKVLLPVMAEMFSDEVPTMSEIMEVAAKHLDDIEDEVIYELIKSVTKGGVAINFDNEFDNSFWLLGELLWEVIQFNFSDLLFQNAPAEEE